jgi:hypothetical protein
VLGSGPGRTRRKVAPAAAPGRRPAAPAGCTVDDSSDVSPLTCGGARSASGGGRGPRPRGGSIDGSRSAGRFPLREPPRRALRAAGRARAIAHQDPGQAGGDDTTHHDRKAQNPGWNNIEGGRRSPRLYRWARRRNGCGGKRFSWRIGGLDFEPRLRGGSQPPTRNPPAKNDHLIEKYSWRNRTGVSLAVRTWRKPHPHGGRCSRTVPLHA